MEKNSFDRSQSLVRVSSASTETDYIHAAVPFDWEIAPGRPAAAHHEIIEAPSLPFPPGRRPKDGFFLPISRSVQRPNLLNEEGGLDSSSKERRPFNLKFFGSSKKTWFKHQKQQKIGKDADYVEETGGFFNPLSTHRFGSRITRRVLVESQKSPSCFGQCLPVGRKASSLHTDHQRSRRLEAGDDSDGEEQYAIPRSPAFSGSSPSSITGAEKQLQVPSSRFNMASMLIALLPSESEEYYEATDVDGGHETTEDHSDEVKISEHLSTLRATASNSSRSEKFQQVRAGSDDFTNNSDERRTFIDCEGIVVGAHSVSEPSHRELRLPSTRKLRQSSFSWKSDEDIEHSHTDSFEYKTPRAGSSTPSMSSPVFHSLNSSPKPATWVVSEEVLKSSSMFQQKLQRQQSHESPRSSFLLDEETIAIPSPSVVFEQISVMTTGLCTDCHVNFPDYGYGSKDEDLATLPATALLETSKSGFKEMSKEVQKESKGEVGSSRKPFPIYVRRRGGVIITSKELSRCDSDDGSGEDYDTSSMDSFEHVTPRGVLPRQARNLPILCKFNISLESETWVVSEEMFEEKVNLSFSLQYKLQRQLQVMGLQTRSMHSANHFENRSIDSFVYGNPIFSKFHISLGPQAWLVYEEVYEKKPK